MNWEAAVNKKKAYLSLVPEELGTVLAELKTIFTNRRRRAIIGFSRGATSVFKALQYTPDFASVHIAIAPYAHGDVDVEKIRQLYEESRTQLWVYYGSKDHWTTDKFVNSFSCDDEEPHTKHPYKLKIDDLGHSEIFNYACVNPGLIPLHLKEQFIGNLSAN